MKQYAVIGTGRFGSALAQRLYQLGNEVLAIDKNEETIQRLSNKVTHAVIADATDENVLKSFGIRNFDVGIVSIASDIESSIVITLMLKEMGVKYVVSKASNDMHAKVLYKIGADRVVFPERDMGERVAHNLMATNILDYIELSPDYSVVEIGATDHWVGSSLKELNLRAKYKINVVAIKNDNNENLIDITPDPNKAICEGDVLIIIGNNENLRTLEKRVE